MESHHTLSHWAGNVLSIGTLVGSLLGWLPLIGAGVAIVWYAIQILESHTVQVWAARRRIQKVARLKARVLILESKIAPLPPEIEKKL